MHQSNEGAAGTFPAGLANKVGAGQRGTSGDKESMMKANATKIRMLAAAAAIAIVGLAIAGLGGYSDAKYQDAVAVAQGDEQAPIVRMTLDVPRVDVVATRAARTRTATVEVPGPQS